MISEPSTPPSTLHVHIHMYVRGEHGFTRTHDSSSICIAQHTREASEVPPTIPVKDGRCTSAGSDEHTQGHEELTEETSIGRRKTVKKERNQMHTVRAVTKMFWRLMSPYR